MSQGTGILGSLKMCSISLWYIVRSYLNCHLYDQASYNHFSTHKNMGILFIIVILMFVVIGPYVRQENTLIFHKNTLVFLKFDESLRRMRVQDTYFVYIFQREHEKIFSYLHFYKKINITKILF